MVKIMIVKGQLSTVLDMKETEVVIFALEDLQYLREKNRVVGTEEEKDLLKSLKSSPSHSVTHRNT